MSIVRPEKERGHMRETNREREQGHTRVCERLSFVEKHHRGNRAKGGTEEVKVWPKESVAASECGLAPVANDLIAADESIQSQMQK